jgi:IclR family acetate operon transcriptional repressor
LPRQMIAMIRKNKSLSVAAILRALGREGVSLGALAKQTGLPRSTVKRIVDALAAEHFVEAGEAGVRLGWGLGQLARLSQFDIVLAARPHVETLFEATRESVDISARQGRETSFLDRIVSDQELRVVPILDKPRPLYAMANGKAMLATMTDDAVAQLFAQSLAPLTPHTLATVDDLLAELAAARSSGFTHDREEHAIGVCAIGAAIRIDGAPAHAISVAVPASRFDASLPLLQAALAEARTGIERIVARLLS